MPSTEHNHQLSTDTTTPAETAARPIGLKARLATLLLSRTALIATTAVVVLAVAGATLGYQAMSTTVTLTVDGEDRDVTVMGGDTVADVLASEDIEIGSHDLVRPDADEPISDGDRISVRIARPVELTVDGVTTTHWVYSTDVESALAEIDALGRGDRVVTSRSLTIPREGTEIEVVTPKRVTVALAGRKPVTRQIPALTVAEALEELDVEVGEEDVTRPALDAEIADGDRIVFTDFEVKRKRVKGESYDAATITQEDDSELEGVETVVREGEPGVRDVTYRLIFRNGELVKRVILRQNVHEEAVAEIISVGTQEPPSANYAGGSTVWDALARCESGGNWAINTGNGYYGGLQFSLSTWRAYGGAGYPHQNSREQQIAIAERVRAATGGYGSWPHCSQQLGLPQ